MQRGETPILVVGAGPTGLTLACELARHGAPVRVVDKLPGIVPYARATGIHSRTLEVFQQLGIVDDALAQGQKILGLNQFANGERFQHVRFADVDSPYPFSIALEQWRTETLLEGLLGRLGVQVERGTELVGLEDRLDGVCARLRGADGREELVETPWLVGCDGAHSRVRHLNRQRFPGEADPRQYAVADVAPEPHLEDDEIFLYLGERGAAMLFPLPEGRKLLIADVAEPPADAAQGPPLAALESLVRERSAGRTGVRDLRWASYFHIHYRVGRHYAHGRTLLAGDAVHVHSPVGGQGMNTGIQDAFNLGWKLALVARGRAPLALLASYEKERRAVAEDVVASTREATEALEGFGRLSDAEREAVLRHAQLPEPDRQRAAAHDAELDLDYRRSPICSQHHARARAGAPPHAGPHAGAQARDAAPLRVGDRELSLFELLRGPRHALLLFTGLPGEPARRAHVAALAAEVAQRHADLIDVHLVDAERAPADAPPGTRGVHDPKQALHRRYDARGDCLVLIRPDGYVAFRSEPADPRALRDYLDRTFGALVAG